MSFKTGTSSLTAGKERHTTKTHGAYRVQSFIKLNGGRHKSTLAWKGTGDSPSFTADYRAIKVYAKPLKELVAKNKWVRIDLADDMIVRGGLAMISVTPEIQAIAEVQYSGGIAPIGSQVPTSLVIRLREDLKPGEALPPLLYVSLFA